MMPEERNAGDAKPPNRFMAGLIVAKLICCGALILLVTGGLTGFGAWFSGVGIAAATGVGVAAFVLAVIWRTVARRRIAERRGSVNRTSSPVRLAPRKEWT